MVCLDGAAEQTRAIVTTIAASLAASPLSETVRIVTTGLDTAAHLGNLNAESAPTLADAVALAAATRGSMAASNGRRTFELRSRATGGEAWEPVVLIAAGTRCGRELTDAVVELAQGGGRGVAVLLDHVVPGATAVLRADDDGWCIPTLDVRVLPVGLSDAQVQEVHALLDAADRPLPSEPPLPLHPALPPDLPPSLAPAPDLAPVVCDGPGDALEQPEPFVEQPWRVMVRLLGGVSVTADDGQPIEFERGKSLELMAWLVQHRDRSTRSGARTALWDLDVRGATFTNVVSEARRAIVKVVPLPGDDWIERSQPESLRLHSLVVCDADLVQARLTAARQRPAAAAIAILRPGVELLGDLPFAGTDYLWPDAEGITSALTLLATAAATELAHRYLEVGDVDGVFWATGQGLRVLAGHEELIALRMRAHGMRGDLAGVKVEWDVYERSLLADPWSQGEPSPKLVAIRRELLSR